MCVCVHAHLVKQCDVEREPEAVLQVDFVGQGVAELLGRGGGVRQQCFGGAVHERHRQHDGFLRLGGLDRGLRTLAQLVSVALRSFLTSPHTITTTLPPSSLLFLCLSQYCVYLLYIVLILNQ